MCWKTSLNSVKAFVDWPSSLSKSIPTADAVCIASSCPHLVLLLLTINSGQWNDTRDHLLIAFAERCPAMESVDFISCSSTVRGITSA